MESEDLYQVRRRLRELIILKAINDYEREHPVSKMYRPTEEQLRLANKVVRGMNSHDPEVSEAWCEHFADKTFYQTRTLVPLMNEPPKKKGRPIGTGKKEVDWQLMPEIHKRVLAGETIKAVTKDMADRSQAIQSEDAESRRLQERYRQWRRVSE
ncbi:MAG TPA: hypothetical protein PK417_09475 [Hyphomonas sp.]|nr:hypothetical protein [Hyphomonas sp.]HRX72720.1 hypothetical protein [Hyphomonas sp.]